MKAAVISFPQETGSESQALNSAKPVIMEDEFLKKGDLVAHAREIATRNASRILDQCRELFRMAKWEDMTALFYPPESKAPEVCGSDSEAAVRGNIAFALSRLKKFDEALTELQWCVTKEPDNFRFHTSLAYTAYNSLYAAKNREIFLHGNMKKERIALASKHMEISRILKPESIANFYRYGILLAEIEAKPDQALPFFTQAVEKWESKTSEEAEAMKHEKKHYIKALYHAAGCLFDKGSLTKAIDIINRCISDDSETAHVGHVFKYFLKGKILFGMGRFEDAKPELEKSYSMRGDDPAEYVLELQARNLLASGDFNTALSVVRRIPRGKRRPYCRWTESDILCALEKYEEAVRVLTEDMDRDRRSRHKSLIRLVKIEYLHQRYHEAAKRASEARQFFLEAWGKPYADGIFWEALSLLKAGDREKAVSLTDELETFFPWYSALARLKQLVDGTH